MAELLEFNQYLEIIHHRRTIKLHCLLCIESLLFWRCRRYHTETRGFRKYLTHLLWQEEKNKVRRNWTPRIFHYPTLTLQKLLLCWKCLRQSSRKIEERGKNNSPFLLLSFPEGSWWHKACYHHLLQKNSPENILTGFTTFSGKVGLDRPTDLRNKSTFQSQCRVRIEVELELTSLVKSAVEISLSFVIWKNMSTDNTLQSSVPNV